MRSKEKFLIINRSFWPIYPVIGEALLRLAEREVARADVGVVLQDHAGIRQHLEQHARGIGVKFYPAKAWSASGSGVLRRALDAIFFMMWVAGVLLLVRPAKVYVSTDPPVLAPFVVMLYCRLFKSKYIYHLQDIHPEAANVVMTINPLVLSFLRWIDAQTMKHANILIAVTNQMAQEIKKRSQTKSPLIVLSNPSVAFDDVSAPEVKFNGFAFCGNAGRLQRIPLLISAIRQYASEGGALPFIFAGGGVYANDVANLAREFPNVSYKGIVNAKEAAMINATYQWALLPIEDEVTRFAFPSKSSSYVHAGACIVAICGKSTGVAQWVSEHNLGFIVPPDLASLVSFFWLVERGEIDCSSFDTNREALKKSLSFEVFVNRLAELSLTMEPSHG